MYMSKRPRPLCLWPRPLALITRVRESGRGGRRKHGGAYEHAEGPQEDPEDSGGAAAGEGDAGGAEGGGGEEAEAG